MHHTIWVKIRQSNPGEKLFNCSHGREHLKIFSAKKKKKKKETRPKTGI